MNEFIVYANSYIQKFGEEFPALYFLTFFGAY